MTTQLETILRRCNPTRIADLTRPAHRRALERLAGLDPVDQIADVAAVLSDLTADVAAVVVLLATDHTDAEVAEIDEQAVVR